MVSPPDEPVVEKGQPPNLADEEPSSSESCLEAAPGAEPAITDAQAEQIRTLGYRPALDGLRGVAILCVLLINSGLTVFRGGFIGVDLFFVLSGFLITSLLTEEWARHGRISLKQFYARRALRLLPALILLLAASCLYAAVFQSRAMATVTYREAGWVLFYYANWMLTVEHAVGSLDHAWSLSVEEQFYFLWPLLLCGLLRQGVRRERVLFLLGAFIVASAAWRALLWHEGEHYLRLYYGSDTRSDALLSGCLLALLWGWKCRPKAGVAHTLRRPTVLLATLFLLWVAVSSAYDAPLLYQGGFTLVALAAGAVLAEAVAFPQDSTGRVLSFGPLVWMGRISYSLYLWHYPVFQVLRAERFAALDWNPILLHGFRFAAVFAAACLSYYLVEQPCLRLKKRFATGAFKAI